MGDWVISDGWNKNEFLFSIFIDTYLRNHYQQIINHYLGACIKIGDWVISDGWNLFGLILPR